MLVVGSAGFWEIAGVGVGVLAVVVGLIGIPLAVREGRRQIRALKDVRDELSQAVVDLKGDVETHYIGKFPEFLPEIIKILESASERIVIFCDLPAYGAVSDPKRFARYMEVLEEKSCPPQPAQGPDKSGAVVPANTKKVDVRLLHLGPDGRKASLAIQFGDSWEVSRENPKVAQFVTNAGHSVDSFDQMRFFELVEREQANALERFNLWGVKAHPTDLIMPLYFWIADKDKAVFALTEFDPDAHEVGFETGSKLLMKALHRIYDRYYASRSKEERRGEAPAAVVPEEFGLADGSGELSE